VTEIPIILEILPLRCASLTFASSSLSWLLGGALEASNTSYLFWPCMAVALRKSSSGDAVGYRKPGVQQRCDVDTLETPASSTRSRIVARGAPVIPEAIENRNMAETLLFEFDSGEESLYSPVCQAWREEPKRLSKLRNQLQLLQQSTSPAERKVFTYCVQSMDTGNWFYC